MNNFLLGALSMGCAVAGLLFLRFWRRTGDYLFPMFAFAFWLLGFNWAVLIVYGQNEDHIWLYVLRLFAFVLIIIAVLRKNREGAKTKR